MHFDCMRDRCLRLHNVAHTHETLLITNLLVGCTLISQTDVTVFRALWSRLSLKAALRTCLRTVRFRLRGRLALKAKMP